MCRWSKPITKAELEAWWAKNGKQIAENIRKNNEILRALERRGAK